MWVCDSSLRIGTVTVSVLSPGAPGEFEVVVYPSDDPDQAQQVFRLTDDEAEALA